MIVSAGIGEPYADAFAITQQNCDRYCADAWRLYYSDYPPGCPPHTERQYAFKVFAIEEAIRAGFRYILWIDSSLAPIAPIEPLWAAIERDGWYAAPQFNGVANDNGWRRWSTQDEAKMFFWCSDSALGIYGLSRAETRSIPIRMGHRAHAVE